MTDNIHEYTDYADMDMDRLTQIVQERYWEEYREYISEMSMSSYERNMLRKWVSEGHSVYDDPGSRYLPTSCYPRPFLEVYREDLEITKALRGKSAAEKLAWLKDYQSCADLTTEERKMTDARESAPELIRAQVRSIRRELAHLWEFIWNEGLGEEAIEFVRERRDEETPFEW